MAKPPDWAMKFRTALNINEFTLFDMFQDPLCMQIQKEKKPCHDHDKDPTVHVRVPDAGNTKKMKKMREVNLPESGEQR